MQYTLGKMKHSVHAQEVLVVGPQFWKHKEVLVLEQVYVDVYLPQYHFWSVYYF